MSKTPITVANGDGIGPEIMEATLYILEEAGAQLEIHSVEIGEQVYLKGNTAGIEPSAWEALRATKVFLKAPITTPQGGGYKSLNVTTRKTLGLYANIRPCSAYYPFVDTKHPAMDVVIIRENEEDLYAGIEHQQTIDTVQCLKLITRPGCERIIRFAFEYAKSHGRKKVTCFTKDNIMKLTDGLFHKVFDEIGAAYPELEKEHWIVDIGAAKLADTPELFDVVVLPNLYGDILSDVAAQIAGSVGLAGSANIGNNYAMFEAIHGSAPRRAGQNLANPSGLFLGSIMMLLHIGQFEAAERAHNAWLKTIEEGIHTYDIYTEGKSKQKVGTKEFAKAVAARIGQQPDQLKPVKHKGSSATQNFLKNMPSYIRPTVKRELVGIDVFVNFIGSPQELAKQLNHAANAKLLKLEMITSRGTSVWPNCHEETFLCDHYRCRYLSKNVVTLKEIVELIDQLQKGGIEFVKTEHLFNFNGSPAFSLGQGQ